MGFTEIRTQGRAAEEVEGDLDVYEWHKYLVLYCIVKLILRKF